MSGSGGGLSTHVVAAKEAQGRELKTSKDLVAAQGIDPLEKPPSRAPSNTDSSLMILPPTPIRVMMTSRMVMMMQRRKR
jgi:hypothetical protein